MLTPGVPESGELMLQMYKAPTVYNVTKQKNIPKQGSRLHVTINHA